MLEPGALVEIVDGAVGATFLSQFPTLAKDVIGADEHVVTLFLVAFTIGIALGSLLCNKLLAGEVSTRLVPLGALGISLFTIDLYYASAAVPAAGALLGIDDFLGHLAGWRIVGDLVLIAGSGGVFIVPLYAFLQARSEASHRSRVIAANNIWNALFMVAAAIVTIALLETGFTVPQVFLIVAVVNFGVALLTCRLLPSTVAKSVAAALLRFAYRVEVKGAENYHRAGKRAVVVVRHLIWKLQRQSTRGICAEVHQGRLIYWLPLKTGDVAARMVLQRKLTDRLSVRSKRDGQRLADGSDLEEG